MQKFKSTKKITTKLADKSKKVYSVKPSWIETINRSQTLLNVNNYHVGALSGVKTLATVLERQQYTMVGCVGALGTLQKHMLNITKFNPKIHSTRYKTMLAATADRLACITPLTMKMLNISRLSVLECETARIIKSTKIVSQIPVSSLQLMDTLKPLTSLSLEVGKKVDGILATSNILKSYCLLIKAQHKGIKQDVDSSNKRLKIIEIATDILQDNISFVCGNISKEGQNSDDVIDSNEQADSSKTAIQYIPSYLGYALKENSTCDLEEEFKKSMICKIITGGKEITSKVEYINDYYLSNGGKELFTPTNKTISAVSCLLTAFSVDDLTFGNVIDSLYMLLYEGSGSAKRICEVLSDSECAPLWDIKHIRTDFRHDVEHGEEKKYLNKKQLIGAAYKDICGKNKPLKQKDWVIAHCNLFVKVNKFLDLIIEKISA